MDSNWKLSDSNTRRVVEAHGLLPDDRMLDEIYGLISLYADLLQKHIVELPTAVNRQKALLAIFEEGLVQEGIIPNNHKNQFEMLAV
jgi:hypothetical protein